jgi:hypothetical protein
MEHRQNVTAHNSDGHRLVVGNGHHRTRKIDTGFGSIAVAVPRVNDGRVDALIGRQSRALHQR